jgi:hypothetical protein
MKKTLYSILILLFAHASIAQDLYVKVGAGYALPMGSQNLFEITTINSTIIDNNVVVNSTLKSTKGSYGAGTYINASGGYRFSPILSIELNLGYQFGKKYEGQSTAKGSTNELSISQTQYARGLYISPALVFMLGSEDVHPYALVGLSIASVKLTSETSGITTTQNDENSYGIKQETKGQVSFGFRGGLGVDYPVNQQFSIYLEGIFSALSYYPKSSEYTSAVVDDEDVLEDLPVDAKKINYKDEVTTTTIDGTPISNADEPAEELRTPLALSNLMFTVGVRMKLKKKEVSE